ncbi:hypothetical protein L7F22_025701 [Adiantum nelumboides]|nr:hypothetical protein [Adiantum nelumboides]
MSQGSRMMGKATDNWSSLVERCQMGGSCCRGCSEIGDGDSDREAHSGFSSQAHNDQAGHELDGLTAADFDDSTFDEGEERLDEEKVPLSTSEIDEGIDDINERYKPGTGRTFPWSKELDESRRDIFRKTTWRPLQEEACNAAMDGKHVIVWMPTAGGKSLCYQLPAILRPGITVVVAPLVALLHDQLAGLEDKCIAAAAIHSGEGVNMMEGLEVEDVLTQADYNEMRDYRIILVTPEVSAVADRSLSYHSSLTSYNGLSSMRCICSSMPTRTDPPTRPSSSYGDFCPDTVHFSQCNHVSHIHGSATDRIRARGAADALPGLAREASESAFSVAHKASATSFLQLAHWIRIAHRNQSGIIYISNIKHADLVVEELKRSAISSTVYHGRLSNSRKQRAAEDWLEERALVMVATNAFGLGIDKADVRFVCHATLPRSLEDYHQECGRRDGMVSLQSASFGTRPATCLEWHRGSQRTAVISSEILKSFAGCLGMPRRASVEQAS